MTSARPRLLSSFGKRDIQRLFQTAHKVVALPEIEMRRAPQQRDYGRILVVTPRRAGKASIRNKIRRRLKSIFYEQGLYKNGYDIAVLVRPGADSLSFAQLKDLLVKACS